MPCPQCGRVVYNPLRYRQKSRRKFCSVGCASRWRVAKGWSPKSEFKKGSVPWNKGKKGIQEAWNKGRVSNNIGGYSVQQIREMYWNKGLSLPKISKIVGRTNCAIFIFMRKHGIPTRDRYVSNAKRKPKVEHKCVICGKLGLYLKSAIRKGEGKYCSRACQALSASGKPAWNKGKKMSEETKRNMSRNHADFRGPKHPRYGIRLKPEIIKQMSDRTKKSWEDPVKRANMVNGLRMKPSQPERRVMEIIHKHALPYRYVGDGTFWIGRMNPDFVSLNDHRKVIEIFGKYWHSPLFNPNIPESRTADARIDAFKEKGWDATVIWDYEVESPQGEQIILERLRC